VKRKQQVTRAEGPRGTGPTLLARFKQTWRRLTGARDENETALETLKDLQWELREREARYRELALAQARDQALDASKAKSRFLAS
jgi:hypothetical protein